MIISQYTLFQYTTKYSWNIKLIRVHIKYTIGILMNFILIK